MHLVKPVEILKAATQTGKLRYLETHCAELPAKSNYGQLLTSCGCFQQFDSAFAARLPAHW